MAVSSALALALVSTSEARREESVVAALLWLVRVEEVGIGEPGRSGLGAK